MLLSHRRHDPGLQGASIALDRLLFRTWLLRRARVAQLVQDSRLTANKLCEGSCSRARISFVLAGRLTIFANERAFELGPGDAFAMPPSETPPVRAEDCEVLEIDADGAAPIAGRWPLAIQIGPMRARTLAAVTRLSSALATTGATDLHSFEATCLDAFLALKAEGLPVDPDGITDAFREPQLAEDQATAEAVDATLSDLERGPSVVSLEERLGTCRRTIVRRVSNMHARHSLAAFGRTDFRSMRDYYRLVIGAVLASHPRATTRRLASMLGYTSPHALCHAFANAGLPSPLALGQALRAA